MNIDKLTEAIQIIVREEIKKVLPKVMKAVRSDVEKQLNERLDKNRAPIVNNNTKPIVNKKQKQFTKDPVFNQILNETSPFTKEQRIGDDDFRTLAFDSRDVHTLGAGSIAEKLGYGDIGGGRPREGGLGVSTGNEALDKAFNRDYSALVKAMDKAKK